MSQRLSSLRKNWCQGLCKAAYANYQAQPGVVQERLARLAGGHCGELANGIYVKHWVLESLGKRVHLQQLSVELPGSWSTWEAWVSEQTCEGVRLPGWVGMPDGA